MNRQLLQKNLLHRKRLFLAFGTIFSCIFLLFSLLIWHLIASAPELDLEQITPNAAATYICDSSGKTLRKLSLPASNRDIISLEDMSEDIQHAIVSIEDSRFYEHNGIDLYGIARAFFTGITRGRFSEGASTITQQLIKNSIFTEWTQERSFSERFRRKIQEQYLALQLEKRLSKKEILENYLNTINFGAGCYGVQAASQRYFGKNASELSLSESAVLAAIPQNPTALNPIQYPQKNQLRQKTILQYMQEQGYITQEEYQTALQDDVYQRILSYDASYETEEVYSWYEDALIHEVQETLISEFGCTADQAWQAVYSGGLRIFSAQDASLQQICDEEFQNPEHFPQDTELGIDYALSISDAKGTVTHYGSDALRKWIRQNSDPDFELMCSSEETAQQYAAAFREYILASASKNTDSEQADSSVTILGERLTLSLQPQASLVLMDQSTGFVRALVGGRGIKEASLTLNRASDTLRQPGSTFKILTAYAPALDVCGQTLITSYTNEPYQYTDGTPVSNWDISNYSGAVTIREAIARSVNIAAVKCITDITPQLGFDYAQKFGISTLHDTYTVNGTVSTDLVQPLVLGGITEGVSNVELCSAYAAIANGGIYHKPKFFTKLLDRQGNVLLDYSTEHTRILQESTAFLLTNAMQDVISDPQGTAYGSVWAAGQPVSGKTGTTSNYKDIWFIGYTPYYTCCVWGGYDQNQSLPDRDNYHTYHKTLWSAVMTRIHKELPIVDFSQPDTVVAATLCRSSHLIAKADACPDTYTEYFAQGTEPVKTCYLHEAAPETEPITLYDQLMNRLLPQTKSSTGQTAESETSAQEAETVQENLSTESEYTPEHFSPESDSASDALEELLNRLTPTAAASAVSTSQPPT